MDISERAAFLKQMPIFKELGEDQLTEIADRLVEEDLAAGEVLFRENDYGETFHILTGGQVHLSRKHQGQDRQLAILEAGDHLGEAALLFQQPRNATATAARHATLLTLEEPDFAWMLQEFPTIKPHLVAINNSHAQANRLNFDWLGEEETVKLICRRHPILLFWKLLRPLILSLLAAFFIYLVVIMPNTAGLKWGAAATAALLALLVASWAVLTVVEWSNDHFIITNQRVVWLEQFVLQDASRQEVPLTAVQSVNIETDQLGRWLNYGDVVVRTFTATGSMRLTTVDNPAEFESHLKELILRQRRKARDSRHASIHQTLRHTLGFEETQEDSPQDQPPLSSPPAQAARPGNRFVLFKARIVEGESITYRKHWVVLLRKVALPITFTLIGLALSLWFTLDLFSNATLSIKATLWLLALVPLAWLWYQYADWNNDIYRLTQDSVIDRDRKPLGAESVSSAPLKNILSLKLKQSYLGRLLNFGTVNINVGDTVLDFTDVHSPEQVQQDIFSRMQMFLRQQEEEQEERERQRMTEWLQAYHQIQQSEQDPSAQSEDDFGVQ